MNNLKKFRSDSSEVAKRSRLNLVNNSPIVISTTESYDQSIRNGSSEEKARMLGDDNEEYDEALGQGLCPRKFLYATFVYIE